MNMFPNQIYLKSHKLDRQQHLSLLFNKDYNVYTIQYRGGKTEKEEEPFNSYGYMPTPHQKAFIIQ